MVQANSINKLNKIIIICGPTASGKTALSIECAKLLNTEIISADSMCVYQGLNIGTAKPSVLEMQAVKHHLIDVVAPENTFTVGDYKQHAKPIIDNLLSQGKIPIICGGTGFYIDSILYNLSYGKGDANLIAREKYKKLAEEYGNDYVYSILCNVDRISANKIHKNDLKRVIRALEIYESGKKKSDIIDDYTPQYDYQAYYIDFDREELYNRINDRVNLMFDKGLISEVQQLKNKGINKNHQCMQGIGYKEVFSYLCNEITLNECIELVKLNTRHYAKRQLTYFKRLKNLTALQNTNSLDLARQIIGRL